ncbi:MAG: NusG domain II-containing protein [Clostridia bacterium]|nr:NusG domain II-containing protein [Clostridia bacterium]
MSLKKIEQVKNSKWFSIWDMIAFGAVILTSVALIIAFTVGRDKSALDGFYVSYKGVQVYSYDFRDGHSAVLSEDNIEVLSENKDGLTLRFYTDGKKGYNDISVDLNKRSVSVTESNCSAHKDCVYTPALTSNSSTPIICTPHSLSVCPLTFDDDGII